MLDSIVFKDDVEENGEDCADMDDGPDESLSDWIINDASKESSQ